MISLQSRALTIKIWPEMSNSPHHRQCFSIVGWIIGLCSVVALQSISNNILPAKIILLSENYSQTQWTLVRMQLKGFKDIQALKHWSHTQFLLQCLECLLLLRTPSPKLVLAHENVERLGDQAKVLDGSAIIICQTQESTKSWHIDRCQSFLQCVHLSLLHPKTS